jgi:hypothetical protein
LANVNGRNKLLLINHAHVFEDFYPRTEAIAAAPCKAMGVFYNIINQKIRLSH